MTEKTLETILSQQDHCDLIVENLNSHGLFHLHNTCKSIRNNTKEKLQTRCFLNLIVQNKVTSAEDMLRKKPSLTRQSSCITDPTRRIFNNITGFQYACWAKAPHMCEMLKKYMTPADTSNQITRLKQATYPHNDNYNFLEMLEQYSQFIDYIDDTSIHTQPLVDEISSIMHKISILQRQMPVHIIQTIYLRPQHPGKQLPTIENFNDDIFFGEGQTHTPESWLFDPEYNLAANNELLQRLYNPPTNMSWQVLMRSHITPQADFISSSQYQKYTNNDIKTTTEHLRLTECQLHSLLNLNSSLKTKMAAIKENLHAPELPARLTRQ